ncbi:MAG: CrcB family protein [Phycisphaerales bacterium]
MHAREAMDKLIFVFIGGGIGSAARFGIGQLIASRSGQRVNAAAQGQDLASSHWLTTFPVATLIVNLVGCVLIGFIWSWAIARDQGQSTMMYFLVVGVLGGFTTFSSFGWETFSLIQEHRFGAAGIYVSASLLFGLLGVLAGYATGSQFFGTAIQP